VLVEAAWHYRHRPWLNKRLKEVHKSAHGELVEMAWKAQARLHRRYRVLTERRKPAGKVVTAMARELVGFIWAVGNYAEQNLVVAKAA
jgi:hypothetical protein